MKKVVLCLFAFILIPAISYGQDPSMFRPFSLSDAYTDAINAARAREDLRRRQMENELMNARAMQAEQAREAFTKGYEEGFSSGYQKGIEETGKYYKDNADVIRANVIENLGIAVYEELKPEELKSIKESWQKIYEQNPSYQAKIILVLINHRLDELAKEKDNSD